RAARLRTCGTRRSREGERLPDRTALRLREQRMTQRDIAGAESPVPEEDRLVAALAPRLEARDDLAQLRMQVVLAQPAAVDVRAQGAEGKSLAALAPVVHHHLVHDVGERKLHRAH